MSLNWDISKVEDYDDLFVPHPEFPEERTLGGVTQALVFATMAVGLPGISVADRSEFYARVAVAEALVGPFVIYGDPDKPDGITPEDVERHTGLHTNVTRESRAAWLKRYVGQELDDRQRAYRAAVQPSSTVQS